MRALHIKYVNPQIVDERRHCAKPQILLFPPSPTDSEWKLRLKLMPDVPNN